MIYILLCEQDKYYIGKTKDLAARYTQHVTGEGSEWTKKYKPIKIIHSFEGDELDEDKYVLKYMTSYGIDNVRGGAFSKITLDSSEITVLRKMIANAQNDFPNYKFIKEILKMNYEIMCS